MAAKKKYYAVRRGRAIGIFLSWDECKKQIDGFGGAAYRGFETIKDAEAWLLGEREASAPVSPAAREDAAAPPPREEKPQADSLFASDGFFTVYTDGSCLKNPGGPGGYAAVIIAPDGKITELSGGETDTTNNRMEMRAGIEALRSLPQDADIEFYTDSQYLKNAFTKYWLRNWKRNGWRTSAGEPVKNRDLWMALDAEFSKRRVSFHWVKGHTGSRFNERCDELARREAQARGGENV